MSLIPRLGVLAFLLVAATYTPTAAASGCVQVEYANFGSGLHVIANSGREIALGLVSGYPGEGIGAILIITPSLCGGIGAGWYSVPGLVEDLVEGAKPTVTDLIPLLPLP